MKKFVFPVAIACLLFGPACRKEAAAENLSTPAATPSSFVKYVIPAGEHYALNNTYKPLEVKALKFTVRFDSSCIYTTTLAGNQWDINKLYGFSDNAAAHQQYSARFGWRWSEGQLHLFAYTYNNSVRNQKELAAVPIGTDVHCGIEVKDELYLFTVNGRQETMPRQSAGATAKGYQLYPYFGGDEAAPHEVRIWIKEEQ